MVQTIRRILKLQSRPSGPLKVWEEENEREKSKKIRGKARSHSSLESVTVTLYALYTLVPVQYIGTHIAYDLSFGLSSLRLCNGARVQEKEELATLGVRLSTVTSISIFFYSFIFLFYPTSDSRIN